LIFVPPTHHVAADIAPSAAAFPLHHTNHTNAPSSQLQPPSVQRTPAALVTRTASAAAPLPNADDSDDAVRASINSSSGELSNSHWGDLLKNYRHHHIVSEQSPAPSPPAIEARSKHAAPAHVIASVAAPRPGARPHRILTGAQTNSFIW
jgi:hypothetical protein